MSSSVNVNETNTLAKQYVLLGGTLLNGKLRSGVGTTGQEAYSTKTPSGLPNLRGISPMPGITSVDIKSKSAYGSLREVIVNFECWDIHQLEDLELLYMRPGYTALIEWGWTPYLDNKGNYNSTFIDFYDILDKPETSRTKIFKDLFDKSTKYGGNYDAMYGYIKNYQWAARADGGYDCQTTIISTGEIIESLKTNFVLVQNSPNTNSSLLNSEITSPSLNDFGEYYAKNILSGIWAEVYDYISSPGFRGKPGGVLEYSKTAKVLGAPLGIYPKNDKNTIVKNNIQAYITLESVFDILNKYVILKGTDESDKNPEPLVTLSLNSSTITSDGSPLLCVAHPLQVSVDPTVCLIKSPLWSGGVIIGEVEKVAMDTNNRESRINIQEAYDILSELDDSSSLGSFYEISIIDKRKKIISALNKLQTPNDYYLLNEKLKENGKPPITQIIEGDIDDTSIGFVENLSYSFKKMGLNLEYKTTLEKGTKILDVDSVKLPQIEGNASIEVKTSVSVMKNSTQALQNIEMLSHLPLPYFIDNDPYKELAYIKNIYINVDYLYKLSLNQGLELQDNKEKNEINLYTYIKALIRDTQTSIGSLNNFELHVDPVDNGVAKIIDVNYTENVKSKKSVYDSLFELQIHNLQSVVRSYSMQSQIFPEQGAIIATGSQVKGGQLGMQNNTMIDFNHSLTDRIINKKIISLYENKEVNLKTKTSTLNQNLSYIINAFSVFNHSVNKEGNISPNQQGDASQLYNTAKNALRDVIVYFQSITNSPSKNRNIIPIKFSLEMDGIGGLVIGHMFKLPKFVLPRGYKGEGAGVELGQTITSISHTLSKNDWITKIDALNIVLSDDNSKISFSELDLSRVIKPNIEVPPSGIINGVTTNADNLIKNLTANKIATIKGNELKSGGDIEQGIAAISYSVLSKIKNDYPDINLTITSGNDLYHQQETANSNHKIGKAIDFTITPNTPDNRAKVNDILNDFSKMNPEFRFLDEYAKRSANATGGHFHISYNVFTKGA